MEKYQAVGVPWGSGIGKDVSDCTSSLEVMNKAKLNFTVSKCDLMAKMPIKLNGENSQPNEKLGEFVHNGEIFRDCPNAFATYRTDLNVPLGLVNCKYEVVQNTEAFKFFDDAIGKDKAIWDRAGCFGYGHKIFVSAKLPITTTVNNDPIENYLVFSTSHDGSSSVRIMFTPIRVKCTNMLNSALHSADSYISLKHTKNVKDKLQRGSEILKIAIEHAKEASQLYECLTFIKMKDEDVMKYISKLVLTEAEIQALESYSPKYGYSKLFSRDYMTLETTGISTRKANIIGSMFEYYIDGIGQKEILGTAWGAYNAITGYYCNVDKKEGEKRVETLLWGTANNIMQKALVNAHEYGLR